MTQLTGQQFLGSTRVAGEGQAIKAVNPATGDTMEPSFGGAVPADVEKACALAAEAFDRYRETSLEQRAAFLEKIADNIEALAEPLTERAHAESGLPVARLQGERGRTAGQLRLFAKTVRDGHWLDARIDPALPDREPLPRPDLRLRNIAVGPVAIFGASNFPLAFSVAGGDTASALAAGCPVVVKAHPAHPGTSELVGSAIAKAVEDAGLPEGVFSMLHGADHATGTALVTNPHIKAVGFTGSRGGGLALMKAAASRPEPIPVFAEMSSINPVLLFPEALKARGAEIGKGFAGSLTMGAGQFCTNPGLVLALGEEGLDAFVSAAKEALGESAPATMLTPAIHTAYDEGVAKLEAHSALELIGRGGESTGPHQSRAALFAVDHEAFMNDDALQAEVFGSSSIIVRCRTAEDAAQVLERVEGQLTITLQMDEGDTETARPLLPIMERRAGRILANAFPTGVEVSHAMVHGGPFPATSDSRTTSVGTLAIRRFLRPVCYQSISESLLPEVLRDANAEGVPRLVDGDMKIN